MLFNSFEYFLLLLCTVALYWLCPSQRVRKVVLFVASMIFYMSWNAPLVLLLWAVCLFNWYCATLEKTLHRSRYTYFAVFLTLAILAYFKYSQFILSNMEDLARLLHLPYTAPKLTILLPLGISFYSFQIIAYTLDAKENKFELEKNPLDVILFIMFFPQLIAGPICHRNELMPQLQKKQAFSWQAILDGLALLSIGLFLKVTFADGIAPFVDKVFASPKDFTSGSTLQAVLGYTVQILGDFWGYSTMAVGSARMFGISVPVNFNLPYAARSLQDFWRRWHITLSLWLRDYLYIPLGGSRYGEWFTYRNLMITMVLGGLWHGANWTFIIWGTIHGGVLAIERYIYSLLPTHKSEIASTSRWQMKSVLQWLYTICVVIFAWIFFRAQNVHVAFDIIKTILSTPTQLFQFDRTDVSYILIFAFIPLHLLLHQQITKTLKSKRNHLFLASLSLILLYLSIIFSAEDVQKFIYFEF